MIYLARLGTLLEYTAFVLMVPLFLYVGITLLKRFWIYRINPTGIYGSDLHMLRHLLSTGKKSYIFADYEIQQSLTWDEVHDSILASLHTLLKQPRSPLTASIDINNKRLQYNQNTELSEIVEYHDDLADFYHIGDEQSRDCVIRFYPKGHRAGVLFDHTLFDGMLISEQICQPLLEFRPFPKGWLQQDRYWPVVSESLQYYTLARLAVSQWRATPLPVRVNEPQSVVHHNWDFSAIKAIKLAHGCTFPDALLAYYIHHVFQHLDEAYSSLRVGIVIGFKNPRFRNNYSVCRVCIQRAESVADYVQQVIKQVKQNQQEVLPLYQIFSTHDLQSRFKSGLIDCLFSPLLFFPKKGLSQHMQQTRFFNVPTGCPLYVFANAFGDRVYCSTTINTPALDEEQFAGDDGAVFRFDHDYARLRDDVLDYPTDSVSSNI